MFTFGAGSWNCIWGNEAWYIQQEKFALLDPVSILVAHMDKPCSVVLCLCKNIQKSWIHGSNFCFLSHETWSSTPFSICTGIDNQERNETSNRLSTYMYFWKVLSSVDRWNTTHIKVVILWNMALALNNRVSFPLFFIVHVLCSA